MGVFYDDVYAEYVVVVWVVGAGYFAPYAAYWGVIVGGYV